MVVIGIQKPVWVNNCFILTNRLKTTIQMQYISIRIGFGLDKLKASYFFVGKNS